MRAEPGRPRVPLGQARATYLGLAFDRLTLADVLAWLGARGDDAPFAYVITPNVDHMVRLERLGGDLRRAYDEADICLCDSRVLARLARLSGVTLPPVPGSDLTAAAIEQVLEPNDLICLIGGRPDHAARLGEVFPHIRVVQHIAPMGLIHDAAARAAAVAAAAAAKARLTLIAVGSPQQELLALEMRRSSAVAGTALCIGASIDFLVGAQRRAPRLVQRAGLEWAWRLGSDPRRLARRYLIEGPRIFPMAWRWSRRRKG